jgi:hypothetical protein
LPRVSSLYISSLCPSDEYTFGWLESTVTLQWLRGGGQYKQFVANRVKKIQEHPEIIWRHVPTMITQRTWEAEEAKYREIAFGERPKMVGEPWISGLQILLRQSLPKASQKQKQ